MTTLWLCGRMINTLEREKTEPVEKGKIVVSEKEKIEPTENQNSELEESVSSPTREEAIKNSSWVDDFRYSILQYLCRLVLARFESSDESEKRREREDRNPYQTRNIDRRALQSHSWTGSLLNQCDVVPAKARWRSHGYTRSRIWAADHLQDQQTAPPQEE